MPCKQAAPRLLYRGSVMQHIASAFAMHQCSKGMHAATGCLTVTCSGAGLPTQARPLSSPPPLFPSPSLPSPPPPPPPPRPIGKHKQGLYLLLALRQAVQLNPSVQSLEQWTKQQGCIVNKQQVSREQERSGSTCVACVLALPRHALRS